MSSGASSFDNEWPDEANRLYKRMKCIGEGAFGSVWMAQRKEPLRTGRPESDESFFAIKTVLARDRKSKAYIKREIEVLSQINHPNCIRLVEVISETKSCRNMCIVLPFANGCTLENLLQSGGALGLPLARLMSRQLMAAVSYLHTRAVIHRDLKPDNIIVEGANVNDDEIWINDQIKSESAHNRWKLMLIDFGLARALTPDDVHLSQGLDKITSDSNLLDEGKVDINSSMVTNLEKKTASEARENRRRLMAGDRTASVSKLITRTMSAVGTKHYAAPEIEKDYKKKSKTENGKENALAACVADYSMTADAYSVGEILREILTGVPPNMDINEYIMKHHNFVTKIARALSRVSAGCRKNKHAMGQKDRPRKFRKSSDVPKDAIHLISGLTKADRDERMTVRAAQLHPWIKGGQNEPKFEMPKADVLYGPGEKIVFLGGN